MDSKELELLSVLIQERLLTNWKKCDQLGSGSQYDYITQGCYVLRNIAYALKLVMPDEIWARF